MRGDVDGYVAEYNPTAPIYSKWFTGWQGAPESNPKPIWRLVGNGRITLDTNKRLPMYQSLNKKLMDESVEIGLISVSKFFVVNKRLKNIYVAFTDFNPALRTAYIVSLEGTNRRRAGARRPTATFPATACTASSPRDSQH